MISGIRVLGLALLVIAAVLAAPKAKADELTALGLAPDPGRDEVEAYCGACHSLKLVVQQGLSKDDWDELLVYMIEEHEMEPMAPADRKLVLDYLSKHLSIEAVRQKRKRR
jgi:cytochrome c